MYLGYVEYFAIGGAIERTAFEILERKAEYLINSQAGGKTGERLKSLEEVPQAVKDCVLELVCHLYGNVFDGSEVQSESQSLGGQSESYTYSRLTKEESDEEINNIIYSHLVSLKVDGVSVLYRGC